MEKPLVSIIIPSYNYAHYIKETIISIQEQSFSNIEIIVIDDGSTDDTEKIVKALIEKDARIKYSYQENKGLSAARNSGIEICKGDYIQFLDADDLISKDKLSIQVAYLEEKELDICYADAYYFANGNVERKYKTQALTNEEWMPKFYDSCNFDVFSELMKRNIMPVNSPLIKRKVVEEIGEFDTNLKSLEDWDYWLRCSMIFKIAYLEHASAYCLIRVHKTSMSQDYDKMLLIELKIKRKLNRYIKDSMFTLVQRKKLLKDNVKRTKILISFILKKQGFFKYAIWKKIADNVSLGMFIKSIFKVLNDYRKG